MEVSPTRTHTASRNWDSRSERQHPMPVGWQLGPWGHHCGGNRAQLGTQNPWAGQVTRPSVKLRSTLILRVARGRVAQRPEWAVPGPTSPTGAVGRLQSRVRTLGTHAYGTHSRSPDPAPRSTSSIRIGRSPEHRALMRYPSGTSLSDVPMGGFHPASSAGGRHLVLLRQPSPVPPPRGRDRGAQDRRRRVPRGQQRHRRRHQ